MASISRGNPPKTSKEMPFIVSLFFLFFYISIFYACSLSPSSLIHNSTFWFFISNTLIFIIAADYAAFSPPRQKLVVYLRQDYYQTHIQTKPIVFENSERNHCEAFEEKENPENGLIKSVVENDPENRNEDSPENHPENGLIKSVVENDPENPNEDSPENHPENGLIKSVVENDPENPYEDSPENHTFSSEETTKNQEKPVEENKQERVEREETIEETDQFSKMTDEELNKRVEEFIKKFNKQIRLQKIQEKLQKSETL